MNKIGKPLTIIGGIILLLAFNMDVSVQSGYGRVNNIGLMADRSNYLLLGALALIVGLILASKNRLGQPGEATAGSDEVKCPFCAELVKRDARLCKHCKSEIQPSEMADKPRETVVDKKQAERFGAIQGLVSKLPKRDLKYFAISIVAAVAIHDMVIDYIWVLTKTENYAEWVSNRNSAGNALTAIFVATIAFAKTTTKVCKLLFGVGFLIAGAFLFNLVVIEKETLSSLTHMYLYPAALAVGLIASATIDFKQSKAVP